MQEKRIPLLNEELKHKKKSTAKGQPRSKHKHIYETVLLTRYYHSHDYVTGEPRVTQTSFPTKVCTICGRIGDSDNDEKYYINNPIYDLLFMRYEKNLTDEAMNLPKWHVNAFIDKVATKDE